MKSKVDVAIVGAGFYGLSIGVHIKQNNPELNVHIFERNEEIMLQASKNNQARVHLGLHYPRSFVTAYRSKRNSSRFIKDWGNAVFSDFRHYYGVAKHNSKINSVQFAKFANTIGTDIKTVDSVEGLNMELLQSLYLSPEPSFNYKEIKRVFMDKIRELGIKLHLNTRIKSIEQTSNGLTLNANYTTRWLLNCTYSGLKDFRGNLSGTTKILKHEVTEMLLLKLPEEYQSMSFTIMDGDFYSLFPYPGMNCHTLSHVRYTPKAILGSDRNVYEESLRYSTSSGLEWMLRDVAKFFPPILKSEYLGSINEIKTVLAKSEVDDGRPILFERDQIDHRVVHILGSKIDNIYDVLEKINEIAWNE